MSGLHLFKKKKKQPITTKTAAPDPEPPVENDEIYDDGAPEDIYEVPGESDNTTNEDTSQEQEEDMYTPPDDNPSDGSYGSSDSTSRPPIPPPPRVKDEKKPKATSPKPVTSPKPAISPPATKERKNPPLPNVEVHNLVPNGMHSSPSDHQKDTNFEDDDDIYTDVVSFALSAKEWYHGDISREEGNKRVQNIGKDGAFLMRKSKKVPEQPYTLVLLYKNRVNNLKVRKRPDDRYALGEAKQNEISFEDVDSIIKYHKEHPVTLTGSQAGETTLNECPDGKTW